MNKPHKHAEIIKDWAEGAEIEARFPPNGVWVPATKPAWDEHTEYRVKPVPAVETNMTGQDLGMFCSPGGSWISDARDIANAAIARALADGQVVPKEEYDRLAAQYTEVQGLAFELQKRGAARDMAVAKIVRDTMICTSQAYSNDADLAAIIGSVKP